MIRHPNVRFVAICLTTATTFAIKSSGCALMVRDRRALSDPSSYDGSSPTVSREVLLFHSLSSRSRLAKAAKAGLYALHSSLPPAGHAVYGYCAVLFPGTAATRTTPMLLRCRRCAHRRPSFGATPYRRSSMVDDKSERFVFRQLPATLTMAGDMATRH